MTAARVHSIVYQPRGSNLRTRRERNAPFDRLAIERVLLREGHGIEGDQKAGRSRKRQINLLLHEWLIEREREGYRIDAGAFGEQLVIAGLAPDALLPETRLRIGSSAMIQLTMPRTGCERLQAAQERDDPLLLGHIGYLAKVTVSGVIAVGDPVHVEANPDAAGTRLP
jgi:MOSC domain-containing protein YiiM